MLKAGDKAPEYLGKDESGKELSINDFAGKKLVVYFYPKDSTPGCTAEACSLRDGLDDLADAGYAVVGVSADSEASHLRFKAKQQLNFPLIADVDKRLIKEFGAWGEKTIDVLLSAILQPAPSARLLSTILKVISFVPVKLFIPVILIVPSVVLFVTQLILVPYEYVVE